MVTGDSTVNWIIPENRNKEHPIGEDISRIIAGAGMVGVGVVNSHLAYILTNAFKEGGVETSHSIISPGIVYDVGPIYKVDLVAAEGILGLSIPILCIYGTTLIRNSLKPLAGDTVRR